MVSSSPSISLDEVENPVLQRRVSRSQPQPALPGQSLEHVNTKHGSAIGAMVGVLVVGAVDGPRVGELEVGSWVGIDVGLQLGAAEGTPVAAVGPTSVTGIPVGATVVGSAVEGGAADGVFWVGGADSELISWAAMARHSRNTSARSVALASACSASSALSTPIVPFIASTRTTC